MINKEVACYAAIIKTLRQHGFNDNQRISILQSCLANEMLLANVTCSDCIMHTVTEQTFEMQITITHNAEESATIN